MITNIGFNVPFYKPKSRGQVGSNLYQGTTANSSSVSTQWTAQSQKSAGATQPVTPSPAPVIPAQIQQIAAIEPKQLARVIYFDTDKNWLNKPETEKILAEVLAFMAENKATKVYLSGHTDNILSDEYNLKLSKSRVDATVNKLKQQGIAEARIDAKYYGESLPAASNAYESGRAANRRVEIVVK